MGLRTGVTGMGYEVEVDDSVGETGAVVVYAEA